MMATTPTPHRGLTRRLPLAVFAFALAAAALSGCLATPGDTSQIELVSTTTASGWEYSYYRNRAYPCAISGYQTFVVGSKVGSDPAASRPLWVKMHGGGVGYFDANGIPRPASNKTEESRASLLGRVDAGLIGDVMADAAGFRVLIVSMCSHDLYGGANTPDPNNPNTLPDGTPITTNGLLATKAAVQFTQDRFPTDDFFLHGGSAGSAGSFHVGWGLEEQGLEPTGIVADSGVFNVLWEQAQTDQALPCARTAEAIAIIPTRLDHAVVDPNNQPDLAVADGRLHAPVLHVWDHGDHNTCGATPMLCPTRSGSPVTMGSADCVHEPLRAAIAAQGPGSRSANMALCVDDPARPEACDRHVPTSSGTLVNTDPAFPADYNSAILAWVDARLLDD